MKKLLFFCAIFVALSSCSKSEKTPKIDTIDSTISDKLLPDSIDYNNLDLNPKNTNTFELTISRLRGSNFIQKSELKGDKAIVVFYKNFNDYRADKPTSNLENSDFTSYFDSEKTVLKTLISAVGKILEKEISVNSIDVQKYYNGKNYHILVSRKALEKHKFTLDNFSDKYVYDNNGRDKFYKTFKK